MSAGASTSSARERELFLAALERTEREARDAFLKAACGADAALRRRVEDLLREQEGLGAFLEAPAATPVPGDARTATRRGGSGPGGTAVIASVTERPGDLIGRYKLLQNIGEGGCGVVYMAEQEEPVRRRVALKVIKLGMDTKSVIARFEAERQALAMMDHPNIAKVLDAGATEAGRPFFVMELVRGVRITEYCDQNNLPTEERLKLFIQVCQAIQHAHQKGIIHRDIKPSNILVTLHDGVPVPKVIDFGIVKATDQRLTDKTLFTEFTAFIGTPAYMSPEQAEMSGLDIDTRSDIYSLGVLLYELLIGKTPFDAEALLKSGLDECRRTIREKEPVRPSTRIATMLDAEVTTTARQRQTEAAKLVHLLRGDLDWIAMKCLEKDRTHRYTTAHDLALDLQRYLEGEPVLARPPSNLYRLRKLVRRHRGAFAAAAGIAATLIIGAGISAWQAVRATKAESTATAAQKQEAHLRHQAEQDRARAVEKEALARLNEYVADINLAQQALAAGNYGRAVQLLNKHQRESGGSDLRGFEWRYLWQLSRGDPHLSLPTRESGIYSLAVSPNGDLLAVGLRDKFEIWNLRTRSLVTTISKGGTTVAFLPGGQRLATFGLSTVQIWNTTDWREDRTISDALGPLVLSGDGQRFASAGRDGTRVFDTAKGSEVRRIEGVFGSIALSPDGHSLVGDTKGGLTVWSLDGAGREVLLADSTNLFARTGPRFRQDRALAFSPDGHAVVAARNTLSERGVFVLSIWDARSGQEMAVMPDDAAHIEHAGTISSLAFSPDGHTLASASVDHSIRLWDFAKRKPLTALQGHLGEVWSLAFAPDGQTLVSGSKEGEVKIWSTHFQRKEEIFTGARHPLGFSKDGRTLAARTRDGSAVVFLNLATSEIEQQFDLEIRRGRLPPFGSPPIAVTDDLRTLAVGRDDGTVKLWDTKTREATTLKVSEGGLDLVVLSPDGKSLITHGRDWSMRRWDLHAGTNVTWAADAFKVLYSPDGRLLAAAGRGDTVRLWNAATLAPLWKLDCDEQPAFGFTAAFSTDNRLLAVVYQDDTIRLWDVATGKLLGTCTGHKQGVRSVAFSPDGKTLATASDDSTLKLWNVTTQQELLTIRQLGATLTGLTFSPDGRLLVGGSGAFSQSGGLRFLRAPLVTETDVASK